MTTLREAAAAALEALEFFKDTAICSADTEAASEAITALKAALAEPVQEPVHEHEKWCASVTQLLLCDPPRKAPCNCKPTAPPQRKPLTDAEIADLWHQTAGFHHHFARAIERAHGVTE